MSQIEKIKTCCEITLFYNKLIFSAINKNQFI